VPAGGSAGQVLAKIDATNYNTQWVVQSGGGGLTLPLSQNLTFSPDGTYDIGNTATTNRPRDLFLSRNASVAGSLTLTTNSVIQGTAIAQNFRVEATQSDLQLNSQTQAISLMTASTVRWQVVAAGHLVAGADNTYDIGASGATRPRDLFLGRNLAVAGTQLIGGGSSQTGISLYISSNNLTGNSQAGIYASPTFSSASTTAGAVVTAWLSTAASTFTMTTGYGLQVLVPTLGAGSSISTLYGLNVANQGKSGITNAYGIYINAQSGAATTNVGLFNAGTTVLNGSLTWQTDNASDIGAAGATRPRDGYFAGTLWVDGHILTNLSTSRIRAQLGLATSAAISNTSSSNTGLYFPTASMVAVTIGGTERFRVDANPNVTATANLIFGTDNTYDIGSSGTARPRDLYLSRTLYVGSANERIRNPVNAAANLSVESSDGYAFLSSKLAPQIASNAYWDGTSWNRFDVASAAAMLVIDGAGGGLQFQTAPSGANPISTFTPRFSVNNSGVLTATLAAPLQVRLVGSYAAGTTFSSSVTTSVGTPISAATTILGNKTLHITYTLSVTSSVAGTYIYTGIGWGGVVTHNLTLLYVPVANQTIPVAVSYYLPKGTLAAGTYTFQVFMQTGSGTMTISPNIESTLAVVELND